MRDRARANREASNWLILLQEEADDEDLRERFSRWLAQSATNGAAWAETQTITQVIRGEPPAYADRWQAPRSRFIRFARPRRNTRASGSRPARRVGTGAAVAAAACLAIVAAPDLLMRLRADALAGTGETQVVHLRDGSVITLAPQSAIAVDVSKSGQREVRILRGRAFFDVARDPLHPFRVVTAGTTTTVLGTAFEVQDKDDDAVAVAVRHGLVKVACDDRPGRDEQLGRSDMLALSCASGARSRGRSDPSRIATWIEGRIVASDRPVAEVIDALRPWQGGIIVMRGDGFSRRRVTGVYDARQPGRVLQKLAQSHDMTVRQVTPWITLVSAN